MSWRVPWSESEPCLAIWIVCGERAVINESIIKGERAVYSDWNVIAERMKSMTETQKSIDQLKYEQALIQIAAAIQKWTGIMRSIEYIDNELHKAALQVKELEVQGKSTDPTEVDLELINGSKRMDH